jgi:DNA-binding MarR family transcriptional regulator
MSDDFPAESDPTASFVRSIRRIAQAVDVRSREIARTTGLTLPQLLVLQSIRSLGEVSTRQISRDAAMSPPTVVDVLDRLEARGLVQRYRSTVDRRVVHARLTPAGSDALRDSPGLLRPGSLARLSALPPEHSEALARAMTLLAELMASDAAPDEGGSGA